MGGLLVFVEGAEERVAGPRLVAGGQELPQPRTRFPTLERGVSCVPVQLASVPPTPSPVGTAPLEAFGQNLSKLTL